MVTAQLSKGAASAFDGSKTLKNGTSSLANGSAQLSKGAASAFDGSKTLKNGTSSLANGSASTF